MTHWGITAQRIGQPLIHLNAPTRLHSNYGWTAVAARTSPRLLPLMLMLLICFYSNCWVVRETGNEETQRQILSKQKLQYQQSWGYSHVKHWLEAKPCFCFVSAVTHFPQTQILEGFKYFTLICELNLSSGACDNTKQWGVIRYRNKRRSSEMFLQRIALGRVSFCTI